MKIQLDGIEFYEGQKLLDSGGKYSGKIVLIHAPSNDIEDFSIHIHWDGSLASDPINALHLMEYSPSPEGRTGCLKRATAYSRQLGQVKTHIWKLTPMQRRRWMKKLRKHTFVISE